MTFKTVPVLTSLTSPTATLCYRIKNGLWRRDPDTESSPTPARPRRRAPAGLHDSVQRRLSTEHAAGEPAAPEGDVAKEHHHRSYPQHQRPGAGHRGAAHAAHVRNPYPDCRVISCFCYFCLC